jgi:hypothetical protein
MNVPRETEEYTCFQTSSLILSLRTRYCYTLNRHAAAVAIGPPPHRPPPRCPMPTSSMPPSDAVWPTDCRLGPVDVLHAMPPPPWLHAWADPPAPTPPPSRAPGHRRRPPGYRHRPLPVALDCRQGFFFKLILNLLWMWLNLNEIWDSIWLKLTKFDYVRMK